MSPGFIKQLGIVVFASSFLHLSHAGANSDDNRPHAHGPDCGEHCTHQAGAVLSTKRITLKSPPGWERAKKGDRVALGFEIAGITHAKLIMAGKGPGQTDQFGLETADGAKLSVGRAGNLWEGSLFSADGSRAWEMRCENGNLEIKEYRYEDLICARRSTNGDIIAGLPAVEASETESTASTSDGEVAEINPQPEFESLPGAPYVLYLDFDGEVVSGTSWNSQFNGGADIVATEPAGLTLSEVEQICRRVAEDYRPFNVNVTTIRSIHDATPIARRGMVIFTDNNEWYGGAGGVAYVGSFARTTSDNPSWVFSDQLSGVGSYNHEAASHEAGHMLGLRHDATSTSSYYDGHTSSTNPSWGPIMGVAYNRTVGQWSIGEYTDANNTEDDTAIIAGVLGYLTDDHANTIGGASPATVVEGNLTANGLIERRTDLDVFSFQTSGGAVSITAQPFDIDPNLNNNSPNLDIGMRLLDSSGAEVVAYDDISVLSAQIDATLAPGTYYVEIDGVGTGDPTTGWSDYGSLGPYTITGTVPSDLTLSADITSPSVPAVSLPEGTGLVLDGIANGTSTSWQVTSAPTGASVAFTSQNSTSTRATFSDPGTYQISLVTSDGESQESDVVEILVEPYGATTGYDQAPSVDLGSDETIYDNRTTLSPNISDDDTPLVYEWAIISGDGQLSDTTVETPVLTFPTASPTQLRLVVTDGISRVFDEVTLTASYTSVDFLGAGSTASVFNATSSNFGTDWKTASATPSGWLSGGLGAGFDVTPGNATDTSKKFYLPLFGSGLNFDTQGLPNTAGYLMRVPFTVETAANMLSLQLDMQFDDGFVAYINGVEVARHNVVANPVWDSLAPVDRADEEGLSPLTFTIDLSGVPLVDGQNILAIHGMNFINSTSGKDKDFRFLLLPSLKGIASNAPTSTEDFTTVTSVITDPNQRGENDDPDGDGRGNLKEYAAGTSLTTADPGYPMIKQITDSAFDVIIPDSPPGDVKYIVEYNNQLTGTWTILAEKVGNGPWTGTSVPGNGVAEAENRESFTFSMPAGERGFARQRFELVSP